MWREQLLEQVTFHWNAAVMPRLVGLTDAEYHWEPVDRAWGIRLRDDGTWFPDWEWPEPDPPPVTTIAWRMSHIACGLLAMRISGHFGDGSVGYENFDYKGTAAEGIAQADAYFKEWIAHLETMDEQALWKPIGTVEGPWAENPFVTLILHISREVIHHAAEIALLRDLYRARTGAES
ncbi:MAG: DinB family protein [Actinomycetota bacterium]